LVKGRNSIIISGIVLAFIAGTFVSGTQVFGAAQSGWQAAVTELQQELDDLFGDIGDLEDDIDAEIIDRIAGDADVLLEAQNDLTIHEDDPSAHGIADHETRISDLEERVAALDNPPSPVPPEETDVIIPQGAATPGCEETNECYIPFEVTIGVGGIVTWENKDTAAHTVTSGNEAEGPDEKFDSSLFGSGAKFALQFDNAGEFDYFCLVHPWMNGVVIVS